MERVATRPTVEKMDTYLVLRRSGWVTHGEQRLAADCSLEHDKRMGQAVSWLRSYVVVERDSSVGTVCVFRASTPEAIRDHAARAELPVDEIVEVVDTIVIRPD